MGDGEKDEGLEERYVGSRLFRRLNDGQIVEVNADGSVERDFSIGGEDFSSSTADFSSMKQARHEYDKAGNLLPGTDSTPVKKTLGDRDFKVRIDDFRSHIEDFSQMKKPRRESDGDGEAQLEPAVGPDGKPLPKPRDEMTMQEKMKEYMSKKGGKGDDRLAALKSSTPHFTFQGSVKEMFDDGPKGTQLAGSHRVGGATRMASTTAINANRVDPFKQIVDSRKATTCRDRARGLTSPQAGTGFGARSTVGSGSMATRMRRSFRSR
jgi:hypothetical protein